MYKKTPLYCFRTNSVLFSQLFERFIILKINANLKKEECAHGTHIPPLVNIRQIVYL